MTSPSLRAPSTSALVRASPCRRAAATTSAPCANAPPGAAIANADASRMKSLIRYPPLFGGARFERRAERSPVGRLRDDAFERAKARVRDAWLAGADGGIARGEAPHGLDHDAAEFHDGEVARAQALGSAVGDAPHGFPHCHVLHRDAADAGEIAELHRVAVLQVIVVARARLAVLRVEVDADLRAAELAPRNLLDAGAGVAPRDEIEVGAVVVLRDVQDR